MDQDVKEISPENLQMQIEGFSNFDRTLSAGKPAKAMMADLKAKSRDLYQIAPNDITVLPGFNPRVHNRAYFEGVEELADSMKEHGFYQDKPLACYIAKIDGEDRLVLHDGHRRHAAVLRAIEKGAAIKTVPVVLKERTESMIDLTLGLLHSNEGQPFSTYEKAVLAKRLKKYGWDNKQIAAEFRCTPTFVGQLLVMASAPQAVAELVQNGNMSATEAHRLMMEHGAEEAARLATAGVARAKAEGRTKITAKDLSPADLKAKNAKKVAYELYRQLKRLRDDPAIEKKMEARQIEVVDGLIAEVEKKPKVKAEPKPKVERKPKKSLAQKVGEHAAKGGEIKVSGGSKGNKGLLARIAQQQQQDAERKATKASGGGAAQARRHALPQRRSDR